MGFASNQTKRHNRSRIGTKGTRPTDAHEGGQVEETASESALRELFIEELEQVQGGAVSPWKMIHDLLQTTYGPCEESPC